MISYYDNNDLKVARCGDVTCASVSTMIVVVDSNGDVGMGSSLALDSSGKPVISYYDKTNGDFKVAKCGNPACTSGNTIVVLDSNADNIFTPFTALVLDGAGSPVISYLTSSELRVAKCGNPACTSGNTIVTIASQMYLRQSSLALDSAGNPVITYFAPNHADATRGEIRLVHCRNATCTNQSITTVAYAFKLLNATVALDSSGKPLILYTAAFARFNRSTKTYGDEYHTVKLLHCGDVTCTSVQSIANLSTSRFGAESLSLVLDSSGKPVISFVVIHTIAIYNDISGPSSTSIRVMKCDDTLCTSSIDDSVQRISEMYNSDSSLKLDSSGNIFISYFDERNGELELARLGTPITARPVGIGGQFSSIALDSNSNPVISHFDDAQHALTVVHCGNAVCTSGNTSAVVDNTIGSTFYTSLKLDSSGNPVISYWDGSNNDLKLARCGNPTCTNGNTVVTVDSTEYVGQFSSLALDNNGNPVISYHDGKTLDLKLARCGNPTCTSGNSVVTVDVGVNLGQYTSLALDSAGNPVISYYDFTNKDLKLVKCGNATCTAGNVFQTVDSAGAVGEHTALKLDSAGNPVISYYDATNTDLKVVHCGNATCSSGNIFQIVDRNAGTVGWYTSLALDSTGNPVISYHDLTNRDVKLARCGNPACTSGNVLQILDSAGHVGDNTSLALDSQANAVISYYDGSNRRLKLAQAVWADTVVDVAASAARGTLDAAQPLTTNEVAAAPVVVETTGQSQRLFLPLVANNSTMVAGDGTTAAAVNEPGSQGAAVDATAVATLTATTVSTATVGGALGATQPVSTTAPTAVITASTPVTVAAVDATAVITPGAPVSLLVAAPVLTESVPMSAPDANGQSQQIFLPVVTNLAGTALGSPGAVAGLIVVVVVVVVGGLVWQSRRARRNR